jgi:hypothetical protein
LDRQWIERRGDRRGVLRFRAAHEVRDESAVTEMHAVEDPDREVDRTFRPAGEVP